VFAGVGERTREGNDLYREMIESVSVSWICDLLRRQYTAFFALMQSIAWQNMPHADVFDLAELSCRCACGSLGSVQYNLRRLALSTNGHTSGCAAPCRAVLMPMLMLWRAGCDQAW
jgi:hypothetical protein